MNKETRKTISNILAGHMKPRTKDTIAKAILAPCIPEFKKHGIKKSDLLKYIELKNKNYEHLSLLSPRYNEEPINIFGNYYGSIGYYKKEDL